MTIASSLTHIKQTLPTEVKLVAVSKFHPIDAIEDAYKAGQRVFGESRMQELEVKQKKLPKDIEWHFIGHLQTNKVKTIVPYIHTIESVDSWRLLCEINKHALSVNRVINCMLELHIAQESSKYGLSIDQCKTFLTENDWESLQGIQITGLMGMASNTDNEDQIRKEFKLLKTTFDDIKAVFFKDINYFSEISMGMSHDYQIAFNNWNT